MAISPLGRLDVLQHELYAAPSVPVVKTGFIADVDILAGLQSLCQEAHIPPDAVDLVVTVQTIRLHEKFEMLVF